MSRSIMLIRFSILDTLPFIPIFSGDGSCRAKPILKVDLLICRDDDDDDDDYQSLTKIIS
jgi:hypothetical protein